MACNEFRGDWTKLKREYIALSLISCLRDPHSAAIPRWRSRTLGRAYGETNTTRDNVLPGARPSGLCPCSPCRFGGRAGRLGRESHRPFVAAGSTIKSSQRPIRWRGGAHTCSDGLGSRSERQRSRGGGSVVRLLSELEIRGACRDIMRWVFLSVRKLECDRCCLRGKNKYFYLVSLLEFGLIKYDFSSASQ